MDPALKGQLYGGKWKARRAAFIIRNPFCVMCAARGVRSKTRVVDHKIPHRGNMRLFWDETNWQPLCYPCHDGAKQAQEKSGKLRGADVDGSPLDPDHLWNRESSPD